MKDKRQQQDIMIRDLIASTAVSLDQQVCQPTIFDHETTRIYLEELLKTMKE